MMKINQELEDKLVGIAVVNGYWYAAAYWLQDSGLLSTEEKDKSFFIVSNISEKHNDLRLPAFDSTHRFWQHYGRTPNVGS